MSTVQQKAKDVVKELLQIQDDKGSDDIHRLVNELLTDSNIEGKTELNQNQIVAISRASWFEKHYQSESMGLIIKYVIKYLQSKDRQGRKELVSAITGMFKYELESKKTEKVEI